MTLNLIFDVIILKKTYNMNFKATLAWFDSLSFVLGFHDRTISLAF